MAELSRRVLRLLIVLLAVGLVGCDHATKIAAHAALAGGRAVPIYDGIVELRYAKNDDTAFSLLHNFGIPRSPAVLLALACCAFAGLVAMWIASRKKLSTIQHVGFAIVVAGAFGNVADRALRGYVVDFIHVSHWPVFNVADVLVVAGGILFVLGRSRSKRDGGTSPQPPASAAA
jgi:signal peptidase II